MRATKEAVTFDFGDGPIPAHQLANGAWVADSAAVSDRALDLLDRLIALGAP